MPNKIKSCQNQHAEKQQEHSKKQNDKIKHLGFTSKAINQFGSFLKKQNIVVGLEKTLSETRILNFVVPQGSLLGASGQNNFVFIDPLIK